MICCVSRAGVPPVAACPVLVPAKGQRCRLLVNASTAATQQGAPIALQKLQSTMLVQRLSSCDLATVHTPILAKDGPDSAKLLAALEAVYDGLEDVFYSKRGYLIPAKEEQAVSATGWSATYGEVMPEGVQALVELLGMQHDSVFYDLGSGLGRLVFQVGLSCSMKHAVGIELSRTRCEQADWAHGRLSQLGFDLSRINLQWGDVAQSDINQGTHFFLCSTALSSSACRGVVEKLKASPNFQVLVTSRQLPWQTSLIKLGEFPCPYSWNLGGHGYVYVKSYEEAPLHVLTRFLCKDGICWFPTGPHLPIAAEEELPARKQQGVTAA